MGFWKDVPTMWCSPVTAQACGFYSRGCCIAHDAHDDASQLGPTLLRRHEARAARTVLHRSV